MDYRQQQAYLRSSRIRGTIAVIIFLLMALACGWLSASDQRALAVFALISIALASSLYYTADYLHLTVVPDKGARWQVKIRWRIAAAALLLGLLATQSTRGRTTVVIAAVWIALNNLVILKLASQRYYTFLFWISDLFLLLALALFGSISLLIGAVLLAAAVHLGYLSATPTQVGALRYGMFALMLAVLLPQVKSPNLNFAMLCFALVVGAAILTLWLLHRAKQHNQKNIEAALAELIAFTGYTPERIRELWETSNQQLAKNWEQAAIPHNDRERMAEWYRQNSELYLFAISAYNLEYKRIKSNLKVIRFARGSTLDYGAGNGEILLELARRGHTVTYFDVEGVTMRFAHSRAEEQKLAINFARTKDDLQAAAQPRGFDTIFSFDVLEHLPDLPGELTFLSSLLAPGGIFVFDVPAGSTKAHPMHLNHNLNVLEYLKGKGLKDRRGLYLRMPFRKEEKWVFEA